MVTSATEEIFSSSGTIWSFTKLRRFPSVPPWIMICMTGMAFMSISRIRVSSASSGSWDLIWSMDFRRSRYAVSMLVP